MQRLSCLIVTLLVAAPILAEAPPIVCEGRIHTGNVAVRTAADLEKLRGVNCVDGDLEIGSASQCSATGWGLEVSTLEPLKDLRVVTETLSINKVKGLTSLEGLEGLVSAYGVVACGVATVALPALRLGTLEVTGATTLEVPRLEEAHNVSINGYLGDTIALPALRVVHGVLSLNDTSTLARFEAPALVTATVRLARAEPLRRLNLSGLRTASEISIRSVGDADLSFLDVLEVADTISVTGVGRRELLSFNALVHVEKLVIDNTSEIASVAAPNLRYVGEASISTSFTRVVFEELSTAQRLRLSGVDQPTPTLSRLRLTRSFDQVPGDIRRHLLLEAPTSHADAAVLGVQGRELATIDLGGGCMATTPLPTCPAGTTMVRPGPPTDTVLECQRKDGERQGPWVRYWSTSCADSPVSGLLLMRERLTYESGVIDGTWTSWWDDGSVLDVARFVAGTPQLLQMFMRGTGELVLERAYVDGVASNELRTGLSWPAVKRAPPPAAPPAPPAAPEAPTAQPSPSPSPSKPSTCGGCQQGDAFGLGALLVLITPRRRRCLR
jgi:hypothetical protein